MTKQDQQKVRILVILLVILGVTVFFGYRMNRTPNPAVVQAEAQKPVTPQPVESDARIRLDLLNKENTGDDLGKKNLFQYGPPPAPPAPPKPPVVQNPNPGFSAANPNLLSSAPSVSPVPPPPPPIPLKYIGFAYVEPNSKQLIATFLDDTKNHFNAVDGDIFMGRYRVVHVTDSAVDVEDLQFKRHQSLPLTKQ